jgi:hypothetical protein
MTGRGWTKLLTNKQQKFIEDKATVAVRESRWDYMETLREPEKRGKIKGYYVLFGLSGDPHSGIHVADFPPGEEGIAEAEKCAEAIRKSLMYLRGHQIQRGT